MSRKFASLSTQSANVAASIISAFPYSFGCWFKPTTVSRINVLMTRLKGVLAAYDILYVAVDATLHCSLASSGGSLAGEMAGGTVSNNTWHHALFVANSATDRRLYLDGGNKVTLATNLPYDVPDHWYVAGDSVGADAGDSSIAECCIWNAALADNEAAALYQGPRPFRIRPLSVVAYWPLFGLLSPEPDLSGNRNGLTLTNAPVQDVHIGTRFTKIVPATMPVSAPGGLLPNRMMGMV